MSLGEPSGSGGGRGALAEGRPLNNLPDCRNLPAKPCRSGHATIGAIPCEPSHGATCLRAPGILQTIHRESQSVPKKPL